MILVKTAISLVSILALALVATAIPVGPDSSLVARNPEQLISHHGVLDSHDIGLLVADPGASRLKARATTDAFAHKASRLNTRSAKFRLERRVNWDGGAAYWDHWHGGNGEMFYPGPADSSHPAAEAPWYTGLQPVVGIKPDSAIHRHAMEHTMAPVLPATEVVKERAMRKRIQKEFAQQMAQQQFMATGRARTSARSHKPSRGGKNHHHHANRPPKPPAKHHHPSAGPSSASVRPPNPPRGSKKPHLVLKSSKSHSHRGA